MLISSDIERVLCYYLLSSFYYHMHAHTHTDRSMMSYASTYKDWLRGWREWARTRKRGKMAQFIVDKLEDTVSRRIGQRLAEGVIVTAPASVASGGELRLLSGEWISPQGKSLGQFSVT